LGGAKKKGLAQMEKAQKIKDEKEKAERKKGKAAGEKKTLTPTLPRLDDKSLIPELEKMKALTPSTLASTYGVRVSAAKDFLEELEKRHVVSLVNGCRRLKIYTVATTAS